MRSVLVVICILLFQIVLFAQNKGQDIEVKLDSLRQEVLKLSKELREIKQEKTDNELEELRKAAKEEVQKKEKKLKLPAEEARLPSERSEAQVYAGPSAARKPSTAATTASATAT